MWTKNLGINNDSRKVGQTNANRSTEWKWAPPQSTEYVNRTLDKKEDVNCAKTVIPSSFQ
jgi:hypothetical protein